MRTTGNGVINRERVELGAGTWGMEPGAELGVDGVDVPVDWPATLVVGTGVGSPAVTVRGRKATVATPWSSVARTATIGHPAFQNVQVAVGPAASSNWPSLSRSQSMRVMCPSGS